MAPPFFDLNATPLNSEEYVVAPEIEVEPGTPMSEWPGLEDILEDNETFTAPPVEPQVVVPIATPPVEPPVHRPYVVPNLNGKRLELKKEERFEAMQIMLAKSVDGKVPAAVKKELSIRFGTCIRTIYRIWNTAKARNFKDCSVNRVGRCGKKRSSFDLEVIRHLHFTDRKSIRQTAHNAKVPKSTLGDRLNEKLIRRHSNAAKPFLTAGCTSDRIQHCLGSLEHSSLPSNPRFQAMHNVIHIDEKWFFMSRKVDSFYMLPGEVEPYRNIRSRDSVEKIMFLAAVARPRYDIHGNCTFDGKIGVFPLVEPRAALRNSCNRPRGTIETKPIPKIKREVIRKFFIENILPAIVAKWPRDSLSEDIYIQQDNAPSHLRIGDPIFMRAVAETGLKISLVCQPANSPDLNVLDLGFFRAIESLQTKECATDAPELIAAVENAFLQFDHIKCNNVFLTLQSCMVEILKSDGRNRYKLPHMAKDRLRRQGLLPLVLSCPPAVYANALSQLST